MMRWHVLNMDHKRSDRRVSCQCGGRVFSTPEPPTDPFYSGRFVCIACAHVWSVENIVQRVSFEPVERVS